MRTQKDSTYIVIGVFLSHLAAFTAGVQAVFCVTTLFASDGMFPWTVRLAWLVALAGSVGFSTALSKQTAVLIDKTARLDEIVKPGRLLAHEATMPVDGEDD